MQREEKKILLSLLNIYNTAEVPGVYRGNFESLKKLKILKKKSNLKWKI